MLKSLRPTYSSITKVKTSSGDKNSITSEAELKALLDEHRKRELPAVMVSRSQRLWISERY